jgi:glutathione synthase
MRFLFVMDPSEGMLPDKDTSFAFMRGAQTLGHECWHCVPSQVWNRGADVYADACAISVHALAPHVQKGALEEHPVAGFEAVFIRKDPPFDAAYLHLTQQLDLVKNSTFIINDPVALRSANEKLYAFHFAEYMPRTLVSSNTQRLLSFITEVGGKAVIKPLDGAGGAGVMGVDGASRNSRGIVDFVTREGRELALMQEYQPSVVEGDKRVLLLDGRVLGVIRRVPRADDIRANIHVGGRVEACDLSSNEHAMVADIATRLAAAGLYFVGLDLIGEKLIEINVTSPTGIQELGRLTQTTPELEVIRWVEQRCAAESTA